MELSQRVDEARFAVQWRRRYMNTRLLNRDRGFFQKNMPATCAILASLLEQKRKLEAAL